MRNPLSRAVPTPFSDARRARPDEPTLLDEHLPEYDVTVTRHAVVDADPETTYEATLAADLTDLGPVVRGLGLLRDLPRAVADRLAGTAREPPPAELRFADVADSEEWTLLDEAPGEELVFGAVGRFWRPGIEWRPVDADAFADFDEPGYAKLAVGLSVRPYDAGRTLLSYEARTATTDERARRRFRRYWRVVRPFAGYLMGRAVARVAADAEAAASRDAGEREAPAESRSAEDGNGRGPRAGAAAAAAALGLGAVHHLVVRPRLRRWGATEAEARRSLPGDDLLPEATRQTTRAVDVDAPAEVVWPWLLELGRRRARRSTTDRLRAAFGDDRVEPGDRVLPKYDTLEEGDVVRMAPTRRPTSSPESAPEVVRVDRERALVVRPPGASPAWTRAFVLEPTDEGTRLLVRTRRVPGRSDGDSLFGVPAVGRAVRYLVGEPANFLAERGLLRSVERRAEETARREAAATG